MPPSKLFGYEATLTLQMPNGEITLRDFLDKDALSMGTLQISRRAVIDAITDYQNADRYTGVVDVPEDVAYVERIR